MISHSSSRANQKIDFKSLASQLLLSSQRHLSDWLPNGRMVGSEYKCGSLFGEEGNSFGCNLKTGKWSDFATKQSGGDLISLYAAINNLSQVDAAKSLVGYVPDQRKKLEYIYDDDEGNPAQREVRIEPGRNGKTKDVWQEHLENGKWVGGKYDGEYAPYKCKVWKDEFKRRIFIVEGPKKAELLISNGFLATTTGGCTSWKSCYAKHFKDKTVTILPDNDEAGFKYASCICADLKGVAKNVEIVELPGLGEAEDVVDWFKRGKTKEDLRSLVRHPPPLSEKLKQTLDNQLVKSQKDENKLTDTLAIVEDKDDEPLIEGDSGLVVEQKAYHGLVGEFLNTVLPFTESDPAALIFQFLIGVGNIIGRNPYIRIGSAKHFSNLFVALVGDSSHGRKGTAWEVVASVLKQVDCNWWDQSRIFGLGSGEGLIASIKDDSTVESAPGRPLQSIVVPHNTKKRALVIEGEFAQILRIFQRDGSTLSVVIRNAWDGGDLRITVKRETLKSTEPHVSVISHITQHELKKLFSENDAYNGIGNRFMWIMSSRSKLLPLPKQPDVEKLAKIVERLKDSVNFSLDQKEMNLSENARLIYEQVYCDLSLSRPGLVGVLSARAAPTILRLSLIYAILDKSAVIDDCHLNAGIALWEYSEKSLIKIFGDGTGDKNADRLLAALDESKEGLTQTEISRDVFGGNLSKKSLSSVLRLLSDLIVSKEETGPTGRRVIRWYRRSTKYEINESRGPENSLNSYFVSQTEERGPSVSA